MIKLNGNLVEINHFPDGTLHLDGKDYTIYASHMRQYITWHYENDAELFALICLVKYIRHHIPDAEIVLTMPYIPHARMDRVKEYNDVFTLKYFAETINSLNFSRVYVLDPHSSVSKALVNNIVENDWSAYVELALDKSVLRNDEEYILFYPDEGSMKRYSGEINLPYAFGVKRRDWQTGKILGLDVIGDENAIKGSNILIIDDICSRGGTFYHSAKKLKELGANKIYLYVTHCENTILEGDLLNSDLIEKVFTTNSIFTKSHEKIEVFEIW